MKKLFFTLILLVAVSVILSGCVVRTYRKTQDRVDQNLSEGNRGYLMNTTAQIPDQDRRMTRTTQVVEVEFYPAIKFDRKSKVQGPAGTDQFDTEADYYVEEDIDLVDVSVFMQEYTVQKNDTLQKISQKFYGTTRKWSDIYQANQDILKGPDQIKPGQVLRIPESSVSVIEEDNLIGPIK